MPNLSMIQRAVDDLPGLWFNPLVENDAYIALGSNVGDRELNILMAVAELGKIPACRVTALSPFYETSPVGFTNQPHFVNAVARLTTDRTPQDLLHALQQIESDHFARVRTQPWGPRTMDLDLLLYSDLILHEPELTIPHPRMNERKFVLAPLCDIAPQIKHPITGQSIAELLAGLSNDEVVRRI